MSRELTYPSGWSRKTADTDRDEENLKEEEEKHFLEDDERECRFSLDNTWREEDEEGGRRGRRGEREAPHKICPSIQTAFTLMLCCCLLDRSRPKVEEKAGSEFNGILSEQGEISPSRSRRSKSPSLTLLDKFQTKKQSRHELYTNKRAMATPARLVLTSLTTL
nr:hypothetical protein BgiMline_010071 [Biomphalaria glabrata]